MVFVSLQNDAHFLKETEKDIGLDALDPDRDALDIERYCKCNMPMLEKKIAKCKFCVTFLASEFRKTTLYFIDFQKLLIMQIFLSTDC